MHRSLNHQHPFIIDGAPLPPFCYRGILLLDEVANDQPDPPDTAGEKAEEEVEEHLHDDPSLAMWSKMAIRLPPRGLPRFYSVARALITPEPATLLWRS